MYAVLCIAIMKYLYSFMWSADKLSHKNFPKRRYKRIDETNE